MCIREREFQGGAVHTHTYLMCALVLAILFVIRF